MPNPNRAVMGLSLLSLLAQTGCGGPCSDEQRSSVTVYLQDDDGNAIDDAQVDYTVDGGESAACEAVARGYVCGWERDGLFEISAVADGYTEMTFEVDVELDDDACHVASQPVTIELDSLACTAEAVPAAEVTVWSSTGEAGVGASVSWVSEDALSAEDAEPCTPEPDSNVFSCALEETGALVIDAFGGWEGASTTVNVNSDGCHPITESVVLQMEDYE